MVGLLLVQLAASLSETRFSPAAAVEIVTYSHSPQRSPLEKLWSNTKQIDTSRRGRAVKSNEIEIFSRLVFFTNRQQKSAGEQGSQMVFESMQMSFLATTICESLSLNLFNRMLSGERNP